MFVYILRLSFAVIIVSSASCGNVSNSDNKNIEKFDSISNKGISEFSNQENDRLFTISEYNTDNPNIPNIDRPVKSSVKSSIDTSLLFDIWTTNANSPHADFVFSREFFHVVDYDGNGDMIYFIENDSLTIYYNDFIQKGFVSFVSENTLIIKWNNALTESKYVKWNQDQ